MVEIKRQKQREYIGDAYRKLSTGLLFLLMVLSYKPVFSQNNKLILYNLQNLKKGVYKNFEEFKTNNPSMQIRLDIEPKDKDFIFQDESLTSYRVKYDKKTCQLNEGEFWGFCDGQKVYINRKPNGIPNGKVWCERMISINRFCYFKQLMTSGSGAMMTGGGAMGGGGRSSYIEARMLNIETGEILPLSKKTLAELLEKNDPELLKEFKEEERKREKLYGYLQRFCDKHKADPIMDTPTK